MKANELNTNNLMVGDWVLVNGNPMQIQAVDDIDGEIMAGDELYCLIEDRVHSEDKIKPIPLTAEILEKNGLKPFKIDRLTEQATAKWWAKGGDYYVKQYNFVFNDFQPTYSFGCHPHTLIERLRYVHELQHALRLCGIDKTIEL